MVVTASISTAAVTGAWPSTLTTNPEFAPSTGAPTGGTGIGRVRIVAGRDSSHRLHGVVVGVHGQRHHPDLTDQARQEQHQGDEARDGQQKRDSYGKLGDEFIAGGFAARAHGS